MSVVPHCLHTRPERSIGLRPHFLCRMLVDRCYKWIFCYLLFLLWTAIVDECQRGNRRRRPARLARRSQSKQRHGRSWNIEINARERNRRKRWRQYALARVRCSSRHLRLSRSLVRSYREVCVRRQVHLGDRGDAASSDTETTIQPAERQGVGYSRDRVFPIRPA